MRRMTSSFPQENGLPRRVFLLALLAALAFLYLRGFLLSGVPLVAVGDEDLFLGRAVHVLHGSVMYRDVFEFVAPGMDLFYAAVFWVFGVHAWVIQACGVVFGMAMFAVITSIATKVVHGLLALLPGMLFLVFDLSTAPDMTHHWYSTLMVLAAVNVVMGGASLRRISFAGVLCALATLFTQTQGGLVFIAMLLYLVWSRDAREADRVRGRVAAFVLPYTLVAGGVIGYYACRAGFHVVFFNLVEFGPRFLTGEVNSPRTYLHQFPLIASAGDAFRAIPYVFIYALVPYVYVVGLYRVWRSPEEISRDLRQHLVLLNVVGLALFLAVASGPRFFRLCTVAAPAILVCVWLCSGASLTRRFARAGLYAVTGVFAVALSVHRVVQWHGVLELPIGRTAFVDRQQFEEFRWLAEHTHPGEPFFNSTVVSLYLALDTPVVVEFINEDGFSRPEQVSAVVRWLEDHPAGFVVMYPRIPGEWEGVSNSEPYRRYVREHYFMTRTFPLAMNGAQVELWQANARTP